MRDVEFVGYQDQIGKLAFFDTARFAGNADFNRGVQARTAPDLVQRRAGIGGEIPERPIHRQRRTGEIPARKP